MPTYWGANLTIEADLDLRNEQRIRENYSLQAGIERFQKRTSLSTLHQRFLEDFYEPLVMAIGERRKEIGRQRTSPRLADSTLAAIGSEELALITLSCMMYSIADSQMAPGDSANESKETTLRHAAVIIGEHCKKQFFAEFNADPGDSTWEIQIGSRISGVLTGQDNSGKGG